MDVEELKNSLSLRKISAILVVVLLGLTLLGGATAYYIDSEEVERQESTRNISFTVVEPSNTTNETNININTGDHLHFGQMPNGTRQTRYLEWNTSSTTLARVDVEGNASEYLEFEDMVVFQDSYKLAVEMQTEETGYYEGQMRINFEAPRTRRALKWLKLKTQHVY